VTLDSTQHRLVAAILEFIAGQDLLPAGDVRAALEDEVDKAGPEALIALTEALTLDNGWAYYPPDPLARRIHHLLADRFLSAGSRVDGVEQLSIVGDDPVVIFANHLSYADANVVDVLLERAGAGVLARRLTALAGPKVFSSRQRRFSSLCFGTVKVPQSADVSSDEASLSARDVAIAARRSIGIAHERLAAGDALLLFGEGTRSRTSSMQPMLAGVARYVDVPGTWLLPVGLTGSELMFPIGGALRPARTIMRVGVPVRSDVLLAEADGDRRRAVDAIGRLIAELLPPEYRGVYAAAV
jgi:1-acyl-sn-glycerol-3-phosphate acyltransferase